MTSAAFPDDVRVRSRVLPFLICEVLVEAQLILGPLKLENLCVSRWYHSAVLGACMQTPQFNDLAGKRNAQKKNKKQTFS